MTNAARDERATDKQADRTHRTMEEASACRLCNNPSELVNVGDESTPYAAEYRNIVKVTTSIKILPNDTLSSWICRSCLKLAIKNYDYCRLAHQRNRELAKKKKLLAMREKSANEVDTDDDVKLVSISFDITTDHPRNVAPSVSALSRLKNSENEHADVSTQVGETCEELKQIHDLTDEPPTLATFQETELYSMASWDSELEISSQVLNDAVMVVKLQKAGEAGTSAEQTHDAVATKMHASVEKILQAHPGLRLPSTALTMNCDARVVRLNEDAVRQHIVKLNRKSRRRLRDGKRGSGEAPARLDVPDVMPTTARELKELVTSSLGLRRTGPATPPTTTTTTTPPNSYDSPVSSFQFPNETPKKSILYPASPQYAAEGSKQFLPLKIDVGQDVATTSANGYISPIDMEYSQTWNSPDRSVHPMDLVDTEMPDVEDVQEQQQQHAMCDAVLVPPSHLEDSSEDNQMDYSLIKIAGEEIVFICDYCHKVFQTKCGYSMHQRVHRRCRICKLTFARIALLREHQTKRCPARTGNVHVRVRRMEFDEAVRHLLPRRFFEQIAAIRAVQLGDKSDDDAPRAAEEVKEIFDDDEADIIDVEEIILPKLEATHADNDDDDDEEYEAVVAPEDSVFSQVAKYYAQDNDVELSEVESMHLGYEEDSNDATSEPPSVALAADVVGPALTTTPRCGDEAALDEAFHVQRLMRQRDKRKPGTEDARVQVTPKDFVSIDTVDATLSIKNLGRILGQDEVVPVSLLYQKHKVKVRIVDYRPPTFERKLYDFSRVTPISMANCRGSANRFSFVSMLPTAPSPTTKSPHEAKEGGGGGAREKIRVSSSLFAPKSKVEAARTEYDAMYASYMARISRTIDEVVSTSGASAPQSPPEVKAPGAYVKVTVPPGQTFSVIPTGNSYRIASTPTTTGDDDVNPNEAGQSVAERISRMASMTSPIVIVDDAEEAAPSVQCQTKVVPAASASTSRVFFTPNHSNGKVAPQCVPTASSSLLARGGSVHPHMHVGEFRSIPKRATAPTTSEVVLRRDLFASADAEAAADGNASLPLPVRDWRVAAPPAPKLVQKVAPSLKVLTPQDINNKKATSALAAPPPPPPPPLHVLYKGGAREGAATTSTSLSIAAVASGPSACVLKEPRLGVKLSRLMSKTTAHALKDPVNLSFAPPPPHNQPDALDLFRPEREMRQKRNEHRRVKRQLQREQDAAKVTRAVAEVVPLPAPVQPVTSYAPYYVPVPSLASVVRQPPVILNRFLPQAPTWTGAGFYTNR